MRRCGLIHEEEVMALRCKRITKFRRKHSHKNITRFWPCEISLVQAFKVRTGDCRNWGQTTRMYIVRTDLQWLRMFKRLKSTPGSVPTSLARGTGQCPNRYWFHCRHDSTVYELVESQGEMRNWVVFVYDPPRLSIMPSEGSLKWVPSPYLRDHHIEDRQTYTGLSRRICEFSTVQMKTREIIPLCWIGLGELVHCLIGAWFLQSTASCTQRSKYAPKPSTLLNPQELQEKMVENLPLHALG